MAKINGVGVSDSTLQKQVDFGKIMRMLCKIWKGTIKQDWAQDAILYYDLNGGFGINLEYPVYGSSHIAAKALKDSGLLHTGYVCEINPENVSMLKCTLKGFNNFKVVMGNNSNALLPYFPESTGCFGLVYADPSAYPISEFNFLKRFDDRIGCKTIDVLISFSAKTAIRTDKRHPSIHNFDRSRENIGKDVWLIRELMGRNNWTFLLGTNWPKFPLPGSHFHSLTSKKGKEIYNFVLNGKAAFDMSNHKQSTLF